jgi:peptidoglycan hydrolase-like protein with peptidoglycan-binding domain
LFRNVNFGRRLLCAAILVVSCAALMPALASATTPAKLKGKVRVVRFGTRTLHLGMRGTDVITLQHDLTSLNWPTHASGVFTAATRKSVKAFQVSSGLSADGVVGPKTFSTLEQAMTKVENTTDAPDTTGAPTATASSAALPADDSGGAGFVPANTTATAPVEQATLSSDGIATAPADAPEVVQEVIAAANKIAFDPYVYGGGHNGWGPQSGYDCSGSTSYALHAAGLLSGMPLDSTQFLSYGDAGPGQWITIYAESGHAYMNIAGLWFDTADQSSTNGNDRWSTTRVSPASGFVARHPDGW